jgi:HNH endonuclease
LASILGDDVYGVRRSPGPHHLAWNNTSSHVLARKYTQSAHAWNRYCSHITGADMTELSDIPPEAVRQRTRSGNRRSELQRLLDRTELGPTHPELGTCWRFTGTTTPYGRIAKAQDSYTHRLGWKLLRGDIPEGKELHHRCGVYACWNPDHLELVTHAENQRHLRRTHCKHGHPLSGENLRIDPRTKARICRACLRESQRRRRLRAAAASSGTSHPRPTRPAGRPSGQRSDLERLIDHTVLGQSHPELGTCWLFTGPATPYGRIDRGSERYTHRLGWKLLRGPIPAGMELHHRCGVYACWNPDHLLVVSHAQNMEFATKARCKRGHPLSGANLRIDPRTNGRICRACAAERQRAFRERKAT